MEKYSQVIFDKNTVEFVTVAAEYCGFLERTRDAKRGIFVDTAFLQIYIRKCFNIYAYIFHYITLLKKHAAVRICHTAAL